MKLKLLFIKFFQSVATRSIAAYLKSRCDITVTKLPEIDPDRRYLFVANHQSRLDAFAVFARVPHPIQDKISPIRYMTAGSIFYSGLWLFLLWCGCFPTRKRSQPNYSAVQQSIDYLNAGQNVFIFPEGKRVPRSESAPQSGVTRIIRGYAKELTVMLVHLEWSKSGPRPSLTVTFAPYEDNSYEAQAIMDAVYKL